MYETSLSGESSTSSWDNTNSYFPLTSTPINIRGSSYDNGFTSGVFAFAGHSQSSSFFSWRASQTLFM